MSGRRWSTLGLVVACALFSGSCIGPCALLGSARPSLQAPTPLPTIAPSETAATRLEEKARALEERAFRIEFTDEEVTSYLALQLGDSLPLASPRIAFQPGKFILEGEITAPIRGHVTLTGTIQAAEGRPKVSFQGASVSGIPLPQAALASISDTISELILQGASNVEIQEIELLAGRILIAGRNTAP